MRVALEIFIQFIPLRGHTADFLIPYHSIPVNIPSFQVIPAVIHSYFRYSLGTPRDQYWTCPVKL